MVKKLSQTLCYRPYRKPQLTILTAEQYPIDFKKKVKMKNPRIPALCLCAMLFSLCTFAQNHKDLVNEPDNKKPKLFSSLPDRIPLSIDKINDLLGTPVGQSTKLKSTENAAFEFDGEIISKASRQENNIESVVIRSSNFNGANLTISKIILADGTVTYAGRIISFQHSDLYELQQQNGQFVLVKRNFIDLVNE